MATATILTDASFCPRTGAAGFGYWIASDRGKKGGGGPILHPCENSGDAEAMAIVNTLFIARKHGLVEHGDEVLIQSDSTEAIAGLKKARWPKIHKEFVTLCLTLDVRFKHVKGHTNRETHKQARYGANRACDQRARLYMRQERARREGHPFQEEAINGTV